MYVVIGVKYDCDDFLLEKSQVDLEIFVATAHQLGVAHLGLVDILVVLVVLDQRQGLVDRRAKSECRSDPSMNQTLRDFTSLFARPALRYDLPLADLLGSLGTNVTPQKRPVALQGLLHSGFGLAYVRLKRLYRRRVQPHRLDSLHHENRPTFHRDTCVSVVSRELVA